MKFGALGVGSGWLENSKFKQKMADIALDIFNQEDETQQLLSHPTFPLEAADTQQNSLPLEDSEEEAPFSMKVQLPSSSSSDPNQHPHSLDSSDLAVNFLLKSSKRLDVFSVALYKYYTDKGLVPILLSEFMYLL